MKNFKDKVAVITGAGTGIGRALALQLSAEGATTVLADINQNALAETAEAIHSQGGHPKACVTDVSDRKQIEALASKVMDELGRVDIVINNAGVALSNVSVDKLSYPDMEWIFAINFWGVVHGTKAFLPHLLKREEASLVNVSSIYGLAAVAKAASYCASKFAVRGFTESLRQELRNTPVQVTVVHPGGVRSNIARNTRAAANGDVIGNPEGAARHFENNAPTTPAQAAAQIIDGIRRKAPRVLIGGDAKFIDLLARLKPAGYDNFMLDKIVNPSEKSYAAPSGKE